MGSMIKADAEVASEWDYIVRIALIDGTNLLAMDDNGLSDPYVRFKLQNEKHKSKVTITMLHNLGTRGGGGGGACILLVCCLHIMVNDKA